jgi:hypothetical protein
VMINLRMVGSFGWAAYINPFILRFSQSACDPRHSKKVRDRGRTRLV